LTRGHLQGGVQVFRGVVHEGALLRTRAVCNATIPTLPSFEMAESACSQYRVSLWDNTVR
jgi:hypothetical protein